MQSETVQDVLLLDPRWLCTNVLGKLLSVETPRALHHYRGRYTMEDVQRLVPTVTWRSCCRSWMPWTSVHGT